MKTARTRIIYAHADRLGYAYCMECVPHLAPSQGPLNEFRPEREDNCESCGRSIVAVNANRGK